MMLYFPVDVTDFSGRYYVVKSVNDAIDSVDFIHAVVSDKTGHNTLEERSKNPILTLVTYKANGKF